MKNKLLAISVICLTLPACSVYMAANKSGVTMDELNNCQTRSCLLDKGAISVQTNKQTELFKAKKPQGSTSRAVMHGALDVMTLGVWEVAGTPIEGSMKSDTMNYFKVTYKNNDGDIKNIQLVR
jgi:hypothetical protein